MSFRSRLFVALTVAALVPLGVLATGVRRELTRRLSDENARRADAAVSGMRDDISRESDALAARLATLTRELEADNRFRLGAVQGDPAARRALLDLAGGAMRAGGLAVLQIQDSAGRIISSGHFRNEFDRVEPALPRALVQARGAPMLARVRTADTSLVVLARLDSLRVGGRLFTVIGGATIEGRLRRGLARDPDLSLGLSLPGTPAPTGHDGSPVAVEALPFVDLLVDTGRSDTARLIVTRSPGALTALRRSVDRWFLAAVGATVALGILAAWWLSTRVSRPLTALAEQTAAIDFDRLEASFPSDRDDEIGVLAGGLRDLTGRLRLGAARLREAERRVATGDLARQVNHDIKNGLVPIRNVVRHLAQVAHDEPESLARVFDERRGTLESSLAYLDTLARNYARLSPAARPEACDVNAVVEEVLGGIPRGQATLHAVPAAGLPRVPTDPLILRRILENLVSNAVDSLGDRTGGVVTIATESVGSPDGELVRVTVADTGPGMSRAELERAFDDFHTTKPGGTGLGLSIVRRLVLDLGGALRIETAPGSGTRAIVELPVSAKPSGADGRTG